MKNTQTKTVSANQNCVSNQCECGKWFMSQAQLAKHRAKGHPKHMTTGARSQETAYQDKPQAGHSPLPWQLAEYGIKELRAKYLCIKHGSKTIARIDALESLSTTAQDEANARLIVASVNHAEALAEALQRFVEAYRLESDHDLECAEAIAREALANWEKS